jgi:hypothetical protein
LPEGVPSLVSWNTPSGWSKEWSGWRDRLVVFGYDWLGRLLGFDRARVLDGEPLVAILEPGTGQLLEVPATFAGFIDRELVDEADAALAASFYADWKSSGGRAPHPTECIGYRTPLFLAGRDSIENLEVCDLDVYISLCGQMYAEAKSRPPGTAVKAIKRS